MKTRSKKEVLFCEKITDIYVCFLITVFSLFCFPDYGSITEWNFKLLFWSAVIYTAVLLIGCLELHLVGAKTDIVKSKRIFSKKATVALFSYLAICVISFLLSEHRAYAILGGGKFDGIISIFIYVFIFTAVSLFGKFKIEHALAFVPVVFLNFILITAQFFGANPFGLYPVGMNYHDAFVLYSNEFLGTFGNVDILSAFLSLVIPLFIALAVKYDGKYRLIFAFSILPASFCLFICKVYSGIVGTAFAIFLFSFLVKSNNEIKRFLFSAASVLAAAGTALFLLDIINFYILLLLYALFICIFPLKHFSRKLFLTVFISAAIISALIFLVVLIKNGNSDSGRLRIWKDAIRILKDKPLFGSGPGTFLKEVSFEFERFIDELGFTVKSSIDCAHNVYLHIAACTGIFSLAAYISFLIILIKNAKNKLLLFPISAYLVCVFFSFEVCSVSALFYLVCGLAVCDKTQTQNK